MNYRPSAGLEAICRVGWRRRNCTSPSQWLTTYSFRAYQYLEAAVTSRGRPIKFIPKLTELACAELTRREDIANPRWAVSSSLLHEVLNVTFGRRFVLLAFLFGER
jgi:hypothetical protein